MIIEDLIQGSPEWLQMRCGSVTASRMDDVMKYLNNGTESQARRDYRTEIVCEVLTGRTTEHYVSPAMEWGIETEPVARAAYEISQDCEVEQVGLAIHPTIKNFAASPDGLVGAEGLVEIKCPNTATHIEYLIAGQIPPEYGLQMLAQMACTERKWCDFVSFDPRLPKKFQLFIRRFERDDALVDAVEMEVIKFLAEAEATITALNSVVGNLRNC